MELEKQFKQFKIELCIIQHVFFYLLMVSSPEYRKIDVANIAKWKVDEKMTGD